MASQPNPIEILMTGIRAALREDDYISFVELSRIEGFDGPLWYMGDGDFANVVFWHRISPEGAAALEALFAAGECHLAPASFFTYVADGCVLRLPIARSARAYKRRHWAPAVLRRGPAPAQKGQTHPPRPPSRKKPTAKKKLRRRRVAQ